MRRLFSIYREQSAFPGWFILLLALLSLLNTGRIFQQPMKAERAIDFRPLYLGQSILLQGENPYDYELLIETWKRIAGEEGLNAKSTPRFLLYPPWALAFFLIFAPFPFRMAVWIWYAALPLMLAVTILGCVRFFIRSPSWTNVFEVGLCALAFKGTIQSMTVGQPAFLCLALGFGSLILYKRGKEILAGVLLGLSAFKISLAVPFVLFFLLKRSFGILATAAITGALLSAIWLILTDDPFDVASSFLHAIRIVDPYSYRQDRSAYPLTYDMINKTEIGTVLEFLFNGIAPYLPFAHLGLVAAIVIFCIKRLKKGKPTDLFLFLLVSLLTLLTTHHFYYDCLILLPLYVLALGIEPKHKGWLFALLWPFFVPVNGLMDRLPTPPILDVLYFTTPITVAAVTLFVLCRLAAHDKTLIVESLE